MGESGLNITGIGLELMAVNEQLALLLLSLFVYTHIQSGHLPTPHHWSPGPATLPLRDRFTASGGSLSVPTEQAGIRTETKVMPESMKIKLDEAKQRKEARGNTSASSSTQTKTVDAEINCMAPVHPQNSPGTARAVERIRAAEQEADYPQDSTPSVKKLEDLTPEQRAKYKNAIKAKRLPAAATDAQNPPESTA